MNEHTFPFDTCEKVNETGIAQPYSTLFNVVNSAIILYFLWKSKHTYTQVLLTSILCFQLFHTFSHSLHIPGTVQVNVIHILTYFMNLAFFYAFYSYTNVFPQYGFMLYLLLVVCFDIYSVMNLSLFYYVLAQSLIFISLFGYYYPLLPIAIQKSIYSIAFVIIAILLLVANESRHCASMMAANPHFPYHIFIEIAGIGLFYLICSSFYKL